MSPLDPYRTEPWMADAACASTAGAGDTFYPEKNGHYDYARRVCATCPVKQACLEYALRTEDPTYREGMWGGTTPRQRRQITLEKDNAA